MKATLTFPTRATAEEFARAWSRHTKTGHVIGSGIKDVDVTVYNVSDSDRVWIENYIKTINNAL